MYTYKLIPKRIVDGDTIACDIDKGFGDWGHADDPSNKNHLRLFGINAPETRRRVSGLTDEQWEQEKRAGKTSTRVLVELIAGKELYGVFVKPDKYGGRFLVILYLVKADALTDEALQVNGSPAQLRETREHSINHFLVKDGFADLKPEWGDLYGWRHGA